MNGKESGAAEKDITKQNTRVVVGISQCLCL
jgi:hypothetical protein